MSEELVPHLNLGVKFPTVDAFVERFWRLVNGDRIFLVTAKLQPVGSRVRFTLTLPSTGTVVMSGEGEVVEARSESAPGKPMGLDLRFEPIDEESRLVVERLLEARARNTASPPSPPTPPPSPPQPPSPPLDLIIPLTEPTPTPAVVVEPEPQAAPALTSSAIAQRLAMLNMRRPPPLPPKRKAVSSPDTASGSSRSSSTVVDETEVEAAPEPPRLLAADLFGGAAPAPTAEEALPLSPTQTQPMPMLVTAPEGAPAAAPAPANAATMRPPEPVGTPLLMAPTTSVPANPFAEVNDEAIEFFVNWSIQHSTERRDDSDATRARARPEDSAQFANIAMTWGDRVEDTPVPAPPPRRNLLWAGGGLLLGLLVAVPIGVLVGRGMSRAPSETTAPTPEARTTPPEVKTPSPPVEPTLVPAPAKVEPTPSKTVTAVEPTPAAPPVDEKKTAKAAVEPVPTTRGGGDVKVSITSNPSGASITLDGKSVGKTPASLEVPRGTHVIVVEKSRYAASKRSLDVTEATSIDLPLARPTAVLTITSQPSGAPVQINRASAGSTPLRLTRPAFEQYKITVSPSSCKPLQKTAYLKPGGTDVALACPASKPAGRR